jgi:hypothetical protein
MIKATQVNSFEELHTNIPGQYYLPINSDKEIKAIIMNCPGCGKTGGMTVYKPNTPKPPSPSWEMNGEGENITLKPSINCVGCCGWHGYLTNGEYKSV